MLLEKNQRFNNNSVMTKQLRKAIMQRSRLKNVFNKSSTPKTWGSHKKTQLLRESFKKNKKRVF